MKLDYELLDVMAAVIRTGSFEEASEELGVTIEKARRAVRTLEKSLGRTLVVRDAPCRATPLGRRMCQHIERVRLMEHDLGFSALGPGASRHGRIPIKIAIPKNCLGTWFPHVIRAAVKDLGVLCDVVSDDRTMVSDRLRSGEASAAVARSNIRVDGFVSEPIGRMRHVAVCSPSCLEGVGEVDADLLSLMPTIVFGITDDLPRHWIQKEFGTLVSLQEIRIPSLAGFRKSCIEGAGWGVLPHLAVEEDLAAGRLVEVRPGAHMHNELAWLRSDGAGPTLDLLGELVARIAAERLEPLADPA